MSLKASLVEAIGVESLAHLAHQFATPCRLCYAEMIFERPEGMPPGTAYVSNRHTRHQSLCKVRQYKGQVDVLFRDAPYLDFSFREPTEAWARLRAAGIVED